MNEVVKPVNITIFDKEYLVSCADNEREQLYTAVEYLNSKLQELKRSGKVIGAERIAIITALNLTHELLAYKQEKKVYNETVDTTIKRLQSKIDKALEA
jgi:cell division protein ZapA